MQVICNNKPRPIIYGFELTDKQKIDFDYLGENINENTFFKYKGHIYDISQFMRTTDNLKLLGFDGYHGDSYFSGILIKLCEDDYIIVARYYS